MNGVVFGIGEFVFNMVKIWMGYELIKEVAESKRGIVMERAVISRRGENRRSRRSSQCRWK